MSDVYARVPKVWPLGTWVQGEALPTGGEDLELLDPFLLYPDGGRQPLWLPGWDRRSVWGFHLPLDAYFALLWRSGNDSDEPDVWIHGYGLVDGRPFAVETTRMLAREIAAATGADLAAVCAAMTGKQPGS